MPLVVLDHKIIAKKNNSLSAETGLKVLAAIFIVMFIIALAFASIGAWMVAPFAGLEVLAFAYAFYIVHVHANDYESITIEQDNILIEKGSGKRVTSTTFNRYWARVSLREDKAAYGLYTKNALIISSHGREIEFGHQLVSDGQRVQLAQELKQKIKSII